MLKDHALNTSGVDVPALVAILQDPAARIDERDDAAMMLGRSNDEAALVALLQAASGPAEDELVAASCGESLAQIFIRTGRLEYQWLQALVPTAWNEVIPWASRERPDLLSGWPWPTC